jgi:hypothetical protein
LVGDGFAALEIDHAKSASSPAAIRPFMAMLHSRSSPAPVRSTKPRQRQFAGVDVIEHDRHQRLHPGDDAG